MIGNSTFGCVVERALKTLADIGPAVFNGGFSTLLAFLLLASSNSYVFDVFFRVISKHAVSVYALTSTPCLRSVISL